MRLIDKDVFTGITTLFDYDPLTDETTIKTEQDVEPHIELAKALHNDSDYSKDGIKQGWWHIMHLPDIVLMKLKTEHGLDWTDKNHTPVIINKIMTDPEFLYLRTTAGKHKAK